MHILTILKAVGIIILVLIALAILLLGYLLFVPFKYEIKGNFDKKTFRIALNDFLHLYSADINNLDGRFYFGLSVLFHLIKILPREKTESSSEKKKKKAGFSLSKIKRFLIYLTDENNHRFLYYVLNQLKPPLIRLSPRYFKLYCKFSGGSPDITGILAGFFSLIPVLHQKEADIYPDFNCDNRYIQGNINAVGGVGLFHFLIALLHIYRHPRAKAFFKKQ